MMSMCFLFLLSLFLGQSLSSQYNTDQLRSLLSYDCSSDGSIDVRGVPDGYTVTVISTSCSVYLTSPGEYNIPSMCKTYDYWGYNHGYPSHKSIKAFPHTSRSWYYSTSTTPFPTTTRYYWYQSTTSDYFGEVDIAVSHGTHGGIVGGKDHHEFRLICDGIHTNGKLYRVSDAIREMSNPSAVPPTLSYRQLRAGYYNYPSLRLTNSGGSDIFYTNTGQLIYLLLSSNDPRYIIRPENCSAQDAYNYRRIELFDIHHSGCILEPYLMEMFTTVGHGQSSLRAPVYSFHFAGGMDGYVSFICNVRICSKTSYNCDLNTCKSKRSQREAGDEEAPAHHELSATIQVGPASGGRKWLLAPVLLLLLLCISLY
ncbi:uncharacterized protein LOC134243618 [Saccostrea cucullata]|uniref:uncharacterized protein LOC134243618 n=1 Tax=Saccostrea cuccullata TaxID=36930 RepID=UPI002ED486FA